MIGVSSAGSSSSSGNGLRWRDAPAAYGPSNTLYNRFVRWSRLGVFDRIFAGLAGRVGRPDYVMRTSLDGYNPDGRQEQHTPQEIARRRRITPAPMARDRS